MGEQILSFDALFDSGWGVSVGKQILSFIWQIVPYLSVCAYGSTALPSIVLPLHKIFTDFHVVTCDCCLPLCFRFKSRRAHVHSRVSIAHICSTKDTR